MYCEHCNGYNGEHSLTCRERYRVTPTQAPTGKCTCGVKYTGGLCSDWCDSRKPPARVIRPEYEYGAYDSIPGGSYVSFNLKGNQVTCTLAMWAQHFADLQWREEHPFPPSAGDFTVAPNGKWCLMRTCQRDEHTNTWKATWGFEW